MARPVRMTMVTIHNKLVSMAQRRADLLEMIDQAGREGTDLVLLPEMGDHHRTHDAVAAHKKGKAAIRKTLGLSLESPYLQKIARLARKHKMIVIPCIAHIDGPNMYDAAMVFGPDGSLLGSYNKTHLAPGEERAFTYGNHLDPIDTPLGKLGLFICWDVHFPEIMRIYELKGAEILLWTTMRHDSFEREFYSAVLPGLCCTHGLPMGVSTFATDDQTVKRSAMNSVIIDGFGMTVAGGMQATNSLVRGTIDLDFRPVMHRTWNNREQLDYAKYLRAHRRTDLFGILSEPADKSYGVKS